MCTGLVPQGGLQSLILHSSCCYLLGGRFQEERGSLFWEADLAVIYQELLEPSCGPGIVADVRYSVGMDLETHINAVSFCCYFG